MVFNRNDLITRFLWLKEKDLSMVVSADYDGLICAAFLHHYLNWQLEGYYDMSNIWISKNGLSEKKNLIWVDLNILPRQGRSIGGHIISLSGDVPKGFQSSCNPNILAGITASEFKRKFPFSTLIYLLWLHNVEIKKDLLSRLLVLHSDAAWLKYQNYSQNCSLWHKILDDYNWKWLFQRVNTKTYEKRVDVELYSLLNCIGAVSSLSKLNSKHLNIPSRQYQFNPDWDEDVVLKLLQLFGETLGWTPPRTPEIAKYIAGMRHKVPLAFIKEKGLTNFLKEKRVFSYAIPSPRIFNFTSFGLINKSPLEKKYD